MPPRASIWLPLANAGGYRAKRRCRVEPASSRRCVRRKRPASASLRGEARPAGLRRSSGHLARLGALHGVAVDLRVYRIMPHIWGS